MGYFINSITIMEDNSKYIIDFDFSLIADFFARLNRQGPGSVEVTKKALGFIDNLPDVKKMVDLGSGTGTQTLTLAENTDAHITAIDLIPEMIKVFDKRIEKAGFEQRISTIVGSMGDSPFKESSLDLIWSEGAIYNIGYEYGIRFWHKYLKPGCFIAVSETSWFTEERPAEIQEFWDANYPEIDTIPNKIDQMQKAGYIPMAHFILPEYCWLDEFYAPMPKVSEEFLARHRGNHTAEEFIKMNDREVELYKRYKEYYGYVFYIGKKI